MFAFLPTPILPCPSLTRRSCLSRRSYPTLTLRTCRVCKKQFSPAENSPTACRHHTQIFSGDSSRKGQWDGPVSSGALIQFWWCCGAEDVHAPGCATARHLTYDD